MSWAPKQSIKFYSQLAAIKSGSPSPFLYPDLLLAALAVTEITRADVAFVLDDQRSG